MEGPGGRAGLRGGEEAALADRWVSVGFRLGVQATGREEERWRRRGAGRAIEAVPEVAVGQVGPAPGAALEGVGSGLLYNYYN